LKVAFVRIFVASSSSSTAKAGTVRALFAESKEANAVHGSDSVENALQEIAFFFKGYELN